MHLAVSPKRYTILFSHVLIYFPLELVETKNRTKRELILNLPLSGGHRHKSKILNHCP